MLTIDGTFHPSSDFERHYLHFSTLPELHVGVGNIAVCLQDNATWLALCFYAKSIGISILPIHPSTPISLAKKTAYRAKCSVLFYASMDNNITIDCDTQNTGPHGLIQMSSGTTGEPKCIKRSWAAIDIEIASYIQHFPEAQDMEPFVACPVTHSYGLICGVLVALARGLCPNIITNINPKFLLKQLLGADKPLLYASPAMLNTLVMLWPKNSQLYAAMTSGTLMSAPTFDKVSARVTHLFQQYGCSETGCVSLGRMSRSHSAIGTPLPHVKITAGLAATHPEEICIRLPASNDDRIAQTTFTQDLGYFEETAHGQSILHFVSRQDDTIIVSGLNVYPHEVEDVVLSHPDVKEAVLFKVEDSLAGQRSCLYFIAEHVSADDLRSWCCQTLASYQIPQYLHCVSHIERLANGKVNRKKLAKAYKEKRNSVHVQNSAINSEINALHPKSNGVEA